MAPKSAIKSAELLENAANVIAEEEFTPYDWARGVISNFTFLNKMQSMHDGVPNWVLGTEEYAKSAPKQLQRYCDKLLSIHKNLLSAYQDMAVIVKELDHLQESGALKRMEKPEKYPCPTAPYGEHEVGGQGVCRYCGSPM